MRQLIRVFRRGRQGLRLWLNRPRTCGKVFANRPRRVYRLPGTYTPSVVVDYYYLRPAPNAGDYYRRPAPNAGDRYVRP